MPPDKGDADLWANNEPARGAAAPGSLQAWVHGVLPRYRGGRRPGDLRADRNL